MQVSRILQNFFGLSIFSLANFWNVCVQMTESPVLFGMEVWYFEVWS